jgi:hypothetical protein
MSAGSRLLLRLGFADGARKREGVVGFMNILKGFRPWSARGAFVVVAGVAAVALFPVAAGATGGGLAALTAEVQALTGQTNTNTAAIASLQNTVQQQSGQIAALQSALAAETAARKQGDADTLAAASGYADQQVGNETAARKAGDQAALDAAKAYTDAETNRAEAAEQALAGSAVGSDDDSATLAAAKGYTDQQVGAEASARANADSSLQQQLNNEINRAEIAEAAAFNNAVTAARGIVESDLTSLAQASTSATDFWTQVASGNWP